MDDSSFALSEHLRVLHQAGIRAVLAGDPEPATTSLLSVPPWPEFVAKLPFAVKSIWSYSELGFDLTGRSSPDRGSLWRTMIRFMNLAKGFVGFFPYTLPDHDVLVNYPDHFLEALMSHVPSTALIFGDTPFVQRLSSLVSSEKYSSLSIRIVAAPAPEALLRLSPEALEQTSLQLFTELMPTA